MRHLSRTRLTTHLESLSHRVNLKTENIRIYAKNNNISEKMFNRILFELGMK
jgi:hypothetical protein